jgi:hypothetical protein
VGRDNEPCGQAVKTLEKRGLVQCAYYSGGRAGCDLTDEGRTHAAKREKEAEAERAAADAAGNLKTAIAFAQLELIELEAGKRELTQCPGIKNVALAIARAEGGATIDPT